MCNETKQNIGDYDLEACLEYNPQDEFSQKKKKKILAVHEGENDEDDWRWILKVTPECAKKNGNMRFVFLQGGCDYTGWDCQSWADCSFAKTALRAAKFANTGPDGATVNMVTGSGFGHMLKLLSGEYDSNFPDVYTELVSQLKTSKKTTWRESKKAEFGLDLPKIKQEQ